MLAGHEDTSLAGGAEVQQVLVAKGLARRGYPVSMICCDFGQDDDISIGGVRVLKAYRFDAGVPVVRFFWPRLTSVWSCMAKAQADVYYQRTAGMFAGVMALFCRRAGKKSIFAAAGDPDMERRTPRIRFARDRWLYEYGLRRVDRIVVQNEEQGRLCRRNYGREATLIPNMYEPPHRRDASADGDVLWVAAIREIKRPGLFLDLAQAMPHRQFRMVGGRDSAAPDLYDRVAARARALRNVDFVGFVPYSRIGDQFERAAVFVNTSESEGFPNTFLEAWSRGVPTVSFVDCGAGKDGRPIGSAVGTLEAMASQVDRWLKNPGERFEVGGRCQRYFEEHHSPACVLDRYEKLFAELCG